MFTASLLVADVEGEFQQPRPGEVAMTKNEVESNPLTWSDSDHARDQRRSWHHVQCVLWL